MSEWWKDWPWRLVQTNLREIDMLDIDAERYVEDLKKFKATVAMINTSGIIASYPTKLPFHFQSPYLKGDSLESIIKACHDANIKVIARMDFSKVRRPIYEAHPEWAYVSPKGEIVDYNGDVHVCINGDYQQKYALEIIKETLTTLDVDGVFFNMAGYQVRDYSGNYYGICHCESCKRKFKEMFDLPLPDVEDINDPVYKKYMLFKKKTIIDYDKKLYNFIKSLRPDVCIANNMAFKKDFYRQESNTAVDRPLPHWQYSASDNTKFVTSSYPDMISSNTSVDFIDIPYRHVAISPYQQKLRLAQNLANGGMVDYYVIGRLDNQEDKSGHEAVREIFHYHAKNQDEYQGLISEANIALLNGPDNNQDEYRGWFRFLVENHFLFDTLMIDAAMERSWSKYNTIIIPDYRFISDELCAKIDEFVSAGGTAIAVAHSAFGDDEYQARDTIPLKCLGIQEIKQERADMRPSYFKIDIKDQFKRLCNTNLIYMDDSYIYADYNDEVERYLKLIPPHMFGPPERCYYTVVTDYPAFTINKFGKGKGVYIPWCPGSLFYRQGHTNTTDFVADLLENILGIIPVTGNLSPMIEVTLFKQKDQGAHLLHLVNGTGHFGVTFFEPVPMSGLTVGIQYKGVPLSVKSLVTGEEYRFKNNNGELIIEIPKLEMFDAVKIVDHY